MSSPASFPELVESSNALASPSTNRLQALYTFTSNQQVTNPAGYEANLKWWSSAFAEALREGLLSRHNTASGYREDLSGTGDDKLSFKADQEGIARAFEWTPGALTGTGRPKGLAGVVQHGLSKKPPTYIALNTFMSSPHPITQPPSLASRFIVAPLWWGMSKLNPFGSASGDEAKVESETKMWAKLNGTSLVHLDLVEEASVAFMKLLSADPPVTHSAQLLTVQTFNARYGESLLSSRLKGTSSRKARISSGDCRILLRYLSRDKGVLVSDEKGEVYKILPEGSSVQEQVITEADRGTVAIIATLEKLDKQIEAINQELSGVQAKVVSYLKQGQKTIALSFLRSKKQLESVLEKRIGTAEQLRTILRGIDGAQGDVEILKAYETSTSTLRAVLSNPALQREKVEATMDALAEALADQEEIDQAIQSGGQIAVQGTSWTAEADDDALEAELQDLINANKADGAGQKQSTGGDERNASQDHSFDEQEKEVRETLARLKPAASLTHSIGQVGQEQADQQRRTEAA